MIGIGNGENRILSEKIRRRRVIPLGVLLGSMILLILVLVGMTDRSVRDSLLDSMQQSLEQRGVSLEYRMNLLEQTSKNFIEAVYPYMNRNTDRETQYREYQEILSLMNNYQVSSGVRSVRLYVPETKWYSTQNMEIRSLIHPDVADSVYFEHPGLYWQETGHFNEKIYVAQEYLEQEYYAISCVRVMRDRSDYRLTACMLFMDVDTSTFDDILENSSEEGNVVLLNREGRCLADVGNHLVGQTVYEDEVLAAIQNGEQRFQRNGKWYLTYEIRNTGWILAMEAPSGTLVQRWSLAGNAMQWLLIGAVVLCFLACYLTLRAATMDMALQRMDESMKMLEIETDANAAGVDRLATRGEIERKVADLAKNLRHMTEKQYEDQLAITEYQMKALQDQIKPHFLYNTLDMIRWMVVDGRSEDGVWMINALSRYLRQSINRGPSVITLAEEIELSETYLSIMDKRFSGRFVQDIDVEEDTLSDLIPKFSLQPLLENALLHGLLYCEKEDRILSIRSWHEDGLLTLEVEDTGKGMNEETLEKLKNDTGVGLSNVRKRLLLFGKEKAGFDISSREGVGTCITITLPIVHKEDGEPAT